MFAKMPKWWCQKFLCAFFMVLSYISSWFRNVPCIESNFEACWQTFSLHPASIHPVHIGRLRAWPSFIMFPYRHVKFRNGWWISGLDFLTITHKIDALWFPYWLVSSALWLQETYAQAVQHLSMIRLDLWYWCIRFAC